MADAALWVRVSTGRQNEANQLPDLHQFAGHHGYRVKYTYRLNDVSAYKGEHRAVLDQALADAYRGEFKILVVWAIDRICREGIEEFFKIVRQFKDRGVRLVSVQEPWLNGSDETTELLGALAAWMAKQESARHSARVKIGLEKRRAAGLPVGGRKAGAKDRKPRKRRRAGSVAADG